MLFAVLSNRRQGVCSQSGAEAASINRAFGMAHVPFEIWPVEEFTYLSPNRFAGTTQADRKSHTESYWENGDAAMIDGPGTESFDHLIGRVDAMFAKLTDQDAQGILVFSHGQFIRAAAWRIIHGSQARS
uniref:histidine phosphatase family protein n=1 Tax=Pseudomonas mohnii TaxID=395600 RepID=UPI001F54CF42|nr:histidine phosphatase family protein [Pseudomonas mohnii]